MPSATRTRWIKTTVVCFVMINVGVNIGIFSPTLPDIEILTSSNTTQVATTLIWTGVASVLGSLAIGPLFDRLNGMFLLSGCLLLQGVAIGLAPTWHSLVAFQVMAAATFFFNFALMSGCLSINCSLWKSFPTWLGPVVQTTDLMHAFGAAIVPQLIRPFITPSHGDTPHHSNTTIGPVNGSSTGSLLPIQKAYLMVAVYDGAMAIVCLMTLCWTRSYHRRLSSGMMECTNDGSDDELYLLRDPSINSSPGHGGGSHGGSHGPKLEARSRTAVGLLAVMVGFFAVNGGRDALLTGLLYTYVSKYLGWTVAGGTLLVTLYHVTRVVVHAILVPVSRWVRPVYLNVANLVVLVVSGTLMVAGAEVGWTFTGAGVIVTGLATSNIHPTTITLVEETVHVGAPIMALFLSAIAAGQIVFAPLAGYLLDTAGHESFTFMLMAMAVAATALFTVYWVLLRRARSAVVDLGGQTSPRRRSTASPVGDKPDD